MPIKGFDIYFYHICDVETVDVDAISRAMYLLCN
jgi:hypothetical protein